MQFHRIADWDDAYSNMDHIPEGAAFPERWIQRAARYREILSASGRMELDAAYGERPRNRMDVFLPAGEPRGLFVFIHGGYWMRFDKSYWSWLAEGALARGLAVVMPSYSLCPEVRIGDITREIGKAVAQAARRFSGPVTLAGHSAGGHLAARMICHGAPIPKSVQARIRHVMPISPVSDLRPLVCLKLNETLKLDDREAERESPALLTPLPNARVTCWVGQAERSEFVRQNALLATIWHGLGARIAHVEESDRHHFNVIDGLADQGSEMCRALFGSE